jgi:hypothetical protein
VGRSTAASEIATGTDETNRIHHPLTAKPVAEPHRSVPEVAAVHERYVGANATSSAPVSAATNAAFAKPLPLTVSSVRPLDPQSHSRSMCHRSRCRSK